MADVDDTFTARVGSNGQATVTFKVPNNRVVYTVKQVTVEYPAAPINCICAVRKNGNLVTYLIPTGDAAGGDPPVVISQSDIMIVRFAFATVGDTVNVTIFYDDGTGP